MVLGENRGRSLPGAILNFWIENEGHGRLPGYPWPFYFYFWVNSEKAMEIDHSLFLFNKSI